MIENEIENITKTVLEAFPNVTIHVSEKRGNLRLHFKADKNNFIPSKWLLCNVLRLDEKKVKVNFKQFQHSIWDNPGKLFIVKGYFLKG